MPRSRAGPEPDVDAGVSAGVRALVRAPVAAVIAVVLGVAVGCASPPPGAPAPGRSSAAVGQGEGVAAAERASRVRVAAAAGLLRRWDDRRAAAYSRGDVAALRRLYTPASAAGSADVDNLRRYVGRGLVVRRMQTQVFAVRVPRWTRDRLVLLVRDRLVGAVAASVRGRSSRRALPADRADRWLLTLHRADGGWLMASVTAR